MDKMSDDTWDYLNGETSSDEYNTEYFTFTGKIQRMDSEEMRFYRSSIDEYGVDPSEYVVRDQLISQEGSSSVWDIIFGKFPIQAIAVILGLIVVIENGYHLLMERKKMRAASSVMDYNPSDMIKRQQVVTGKEALERVNQPLFVSFVQKKKKAVAISLVVALIGVLGAAGFVGYHRFYKPTAEQAKVYDMDNESEFSEVNQDSVVELSTTYFPMLFYSESGSSSGYYIIYTEHNAFVSELSDKEYKKAADEIRNTGSTKLHGYASRITGEIAAEAAEFVNGRYGENFSEEEMYDEVGRYMIVVEDSYRGGGVTEDVAYALAITLLVVAGIALLFALIKYINLHIFKNEARYLSDGEFGRLEASMDSPETARFSNNLFCTDKHLVVLGAATKFVAYSDILWAYLKVTKQYGKEVAYEIQVVDKNRGAYSLPAFGANENNSRLMNMLLGIIHSKNPNARIGYTQANIQAAANTNMTQQ